MVFEKFRLVSKSPGPTPVLCPIPNGLSLVTVSPLLSKPVVMLYGVPAEKIISGLTLIACGKDRVPYRKNL